MNKIVILGGGISGFGSAVLARQQGFDVFLSDSGTLDSKTQALLKAHSIPFEYGGHSTARILQADEVIKSPGIPDTAPIIQTLSARGIPIISEIEFASRFTSSRIIAITGSNGKTTTTTLAFEMLRDAGFSVGLAGNIGDSFALQVATSQKDWYVLELSSFQLDGCRDFRADIAVLLNITPDHLDRYGGSFDRYASSKMSIARNQRPCDTFIFRSDDPKTVEMLARTNIPSHKLSFSGPDNAAAASLAASAAGVPPESIALTLANFKGIPHRIQSVATVDGVEWINDSKATNVDSVHFALSQMTRPVVWIAGGTDKGNDYSALAPFAPKIKTLVCMGTDNSKLLKAFSGLIPQVISTSSLDAALTAASKAASSGDVVLLSPACASFDLFKNYEDRGNQFTKWIQRKK